MQSRFKGQGYVSCLKATLDSPIEEISRKKYTTKALSNLCVVAKTKTQSTVDILNSETELFPNSKIKVIFLL